jgi:benzoyl-CoA reductase/2-hydroxyglutaryl-CoA dehydratase subunit BcrC/BadD/HgdB
MVADHSETSRESLGRIMSRYYEGNHCAAREGKFVIWAAIIVPVELLKGFDVIVAFPESHSAMCAARGVGPLQSEKAERAGYSMDLCSYARIDLGTVFQGGSGSPAAGLPKPDLLVSNTDNCSLLVKWFDVYHREFGVPHFTLDIPFCYGPQESKDLEYIAEQFRNLVQLVERATDQRFDLDKVSEAVGESSRGLKEWRRFLRVGACRPSGVTAFDTFAHMAPYFTWMRGAREMTEHFRLVADEAEARVARGEYPVSGERYRLLWDNIAPWHQLRKMSDRLAGLGANIVCSTYTGCMGTLEGGVEAPEYDGGDPIRHLARMQNMAICCYGLDLRLRAMSAMIETYGVDGVVFGSNRSCKPYSALQMDLQRLVAERHGVATVMVDVDHADVRKYNEAEVFTRIESMLERIEADRCALG